jgi:hypothetical protein
VHIHNGTSTAGPHVLGMGAAANGQVNAYYANGIACPDGIYVDVIAGTLTGSLFYKLTQ